jgi:hypothetical protein
MQQCRSSRPGSPTATLCVDAVATGTGDGATSDGREDRGVLLALGEHPRGGTDTDDDETGRDRNGRRRLGSAAELRRREAAERLGRRRGGSDQRGELHVLDVKDETITTDARWRAAYGVGQEVPAKANQVDWEATGADQETEAVARGMTLTRIEDGAFDSNQPNDFHFFTTEGGDTTSVENDPVTGAPISRVGGGLWRLRFADVSKPSAGMTLELVLDGSEAPYLNKPDNMDIDEEGHLLFQEDPGVNAHPARVLAYEIASCDFATLTEFGPARFASGATGYPTTVEEESSGIIDVADLMGRGVFPSTPRSTPAPDCPTPPARCSTVSCRS